MMIRGALSRRWAGGKVADLTTPEQVIPHHPSQYPDKQVFKCGVGTDIASEEPIFGPHGYKPLPPPSKKHYSNSDGWGTVTITTTKALRMPFQHKKVLPKPARKVAIFGATGFAGSRIAKRMVESGDYEEIRLCTRYPDDVPKDLSKVIAMKPELFTLEEVNVLDMPSVNRALDGCDTAINAIDMRTDDFYNLHHDVYVKGCSNIGFQSRVTGVKRYVFISGLDAQWNSESERSDFRAKAEEMALAENFFSVILRPGSLYGSGARYSEFGKMFYPTVHPDTILQPTWVNDLAEACHRVIQRPDAVKRVIDLGGPKEMTHMEYAVQRANHMKGPKPFPCPMMLGDIAAWFNEFVNPNPHFSRDFINVMEMDQVDRPADLNPYVWHWSDLNMTPASIEDAAKAEAAGAAF